MDLAMRIDQQEIDRRIKNFEKICRTQGVKLTHQRLEIFREVAESDEHPDAEKVYQGVRKRIQTVSLDTVYRTLWLLTDLGLVKTLEPSSGRARFDANLDRHHHFVCKKCGLTKDIFNKDYDDLKVPKSINSLGQAQTTHVEIRGICLGCINSNRSKQKKMK
jgi:Fur family transcriptional regulator, peroxide stress response regulator